MMGWRWGHRLALERVYGSGGWFCRVQGDSDFVSQYPEEAQLYDKYWIRQKQRFKVLLEKYDEIGAAVWTPKNAGDFEIKGSVAQTRKAFKQIASEHCVGQSQIVGGGTSGGMITAREAFKQASQGSIVLIDIRHPSEWAKTGIGANAVPITMHQKLSKFVDELIKVAGPEKRPIALICAEGVRSAAMQKRLMPYGFKGVINVSEGMIGSKSGPGWIESELPVKHVNHQQASIGQ